VRLSGSAVGPGRLAARDLAELARLLDQAVLRVGRVLFRARRRGAGPSARDLDAACRLYLGSWSHGSAVAGFDLAEPRPGKPSYQDIGEHSLRHFVAGLSSITAEESLGTLIPEGFDEGVLRTCVALGKLLDHGIETLSLTEPPQRQTPPVRYDVSTCRRIRALLDRERVSAHRAELEPSRQTPIFPMGPDTGVGPPALETSFWKPASPDELAADQGVLPITDISELDGVWSEGDVFDDAISEVLRDRVQRRREGLAR
jgi:hypothetical protein